MPAKNKKLPTEQKPNKQPIKKKQLFAHVSKTLFWFTIGMALGLFIIVSFSFFLFQQFYKEKTYPGIYIGGQNFGGMTPQKINQYYENKNAVIHQTTFTFILDNTIATVSAAQMHFGYDSVLLAKQAYTLGRSDDVMTNAGIIFQAYLTGVTLSPSYTYSEQSLEKQLSSMIHEAKIDPVDAIFTFENGKVTTFRPSSNGKEIDLPRLQQDIMAKIPYIIASDQVQSFVIHVPVKIIKPKINTSDANSLGITQLIGSGTSLFQHSIPGRIYNVQLAASRVNGTLIKPGEEFSFAKAVGDVSAFTGYQQAYVIQNGKTVLGDGGGVCQVSTTLFRAALSAGLPITERHAHAYRVGYYEEDSPPGIDATVYVPSVDLKFKNDTGHSILIQTAVDPVQLRLTFYLYGTNDGRTTTMTTPVVSKIIPAPPTIYTDDPSLPTGTLKQVDFSAAGASVSFSRTVMKDGKVYISDTYNSHYQAWAAAYLRGTGPQ